MWTYQLLLFSAHLVILMNRVIAPFMHGGVFRSLSNFAAPGNPLAVRYIEMFHADFSYLSIYTRKGKQSLVRNQKSFKILWKDSVV